MAGESEPGDGCAGLEIRLLGPFELRVRGEAAGSALPRKARWILALLCLRPGRDVERGWLAGTVWPECLWDRALFNLRRDLSHLRRALGPEAARLESPAGSVLRLDLNGADVDVLRFDAAIRAGGEAAWEAAAELYRGPLLEGCGEEWVLHERETRAQHYLAAVEGLAAAALERGEPAAAIRRLRVAAAADPLRESACRGLMTALAREGDFAAAASVYRDLRSLFLRDLNAEPSPETTALFQSLRAESRKRAAGPPPAAGPPSPESAAAAPTAPRRRRGRVPRPLTPLIGREGELRAGRALLASSRLVTLTGPGGVGKSRLALQVALDSMEDYEGGAWFVELAPLDDPELVAQHVADALGIGEAPGVTPEALLVAELAERELLLLLDNCEHLLEACARLADELLRQCPGMRILATSRQCLGITGEAAWQVPCLSTPEPGSLGRAGRDPVALALRFEAIRLFVERAGQAQPGFRLTREHVRSVADVCHRLDGMPLAIELAAARVRVLPVEEISRRLDDRFQLLTGGSRTALPRQQTLRAAMDWSYNLLPAEEQGLLRRLTIFSGGWCLSAAERVCAPASGAPDTVLDLLTRLVEKSLIRVEDEGGSRRYTLLETVRQYGRELLVATDESDAARDRHLAYFVDLADEAEPHIFPAEPHPVYLPILDREVGNFRVAFEWCEELFRRGAAAERERAAVAAVRMSGALTWFWFLRGQFREGRRWVRAALERREAAAASPAARGRCLMAASCLAFWQGDYPACGPSAEAGVAAYREAQYPLGVAYALVGCAVADLLAGSQAAARTGLEEARRLAAAYPDSRVIPFILYWVAIEAEEAGDPGRARAALEEAHAFGRARRSRSTMVHILYSLGRVACAQGDFAAGRRYCLESLAVARESDDRWGAAFALESLAVAAAGEGDGCRAAWLAGAAEVIREAIHAPQPVFGREQYARILASARAAAGAGAYEAARLEGRRLPLESVLDRLLGEQ